MRYLTLEKRRAQCRPVRDCAGAQARWHFLVSTSVSTPLHISCKSSAHHLHIICTGMPAPELLRAYKERGRISTQTPQQHVDAVLSNQRKWYYIAATKHPPQNWFGPTNLSREELAQAY